MIPSSDLYIYCVQDPSDTEGSGAIVGNYCDVMVVSGLGGKDGDVRVVGEQEMVSVSPVKFLLLMLEY